MEPILKQFMTELGFITEKYELENSLEKQMVGDIWKILGGEVRNHVTLNNIRIFLLAIMGSFVEPLLNKKE
jgi:hypothetical protein